MFKVKGIYVLVIFLIPVLIGFSINLDTDKEANKEGVSTTSNMLVTDSFQGCSNNTSIISFLSANVKAQSNDGGLFLTFSGNCYHTCKDGTQFTGSDCCASTGEDLCSENGGWDQCSGPLKECDPSDCDGTGEG